MLKNMYKPMMWNQGMPGMITPQAKAIAVANTIGNPAIKNMQGTSRIIYDTLPLNGATEMRFFEGAGARPFPFSNLDSNAGKLNVGEVMVIQYAQLLFFVRNPDTGAISQVQSVNDIPNFQLGEMSFMVGEQQVLKRLKLINFTDEYNKDSRIPGYNVYRFDTYVSIQSLLEFTAVVRPAAGVTVTNGYAQLILEGAGSLYSPKANQ